MSSGIKLTRRAGKPELKRPSTLVPAVAAVAAFHETGGSGAEDALQCADDLSKDLGDESH